MLNHEYLPTVLMLSLSLAGNLQAADFSLSLRQQTDKNQTLQRTIEKQSWKVNETAFIVCDVWDYHHSINAVRRLEEFSPTLNKVLQTARSQGSLIIHSPSDCMDAYKDNPARLRATNSPKAVNLPLNIESWCSRIPAEEKAFYPIDQSDGGEDDDPAEHKAWALKLKGLGRNPGMPWKAQSSLIEIDANKDFISDKGDEVWNILEQKRIKNVVLLGVHTNMCVLGRPFGLRQLVRNNKNVVLMRDMTDSMYNPKQWPYVDHFTGHDLVISHVERFVCPTITSDQIIGGKPFEFKNDSRKIKDVQTLNDLKKVDADSLRKYWNTISLPVSPDVQALLQQGKVQWYRSCIRIPSEWISEKGVNLHLQNSASVANAWINGNELVVNTNAEGVSSWLIKTDFINKDDANLLVIRIEDPTAQKNQLHLANLVGKNSLSLAGRWEARLGDDSSWSNIPLPAKFGTSPNVFFEPSK